jgi:hypothetical protein
VDSLLARGDRARVAIAVESTKSIPANAGSGSRQFDEVYDVPDAGYAAAAFPADALGECGRRPAADGCDAVVGVNFGERQTGNLPGFYEFENPVFNACVGHGSSPLFCTLL